MESAHERIAAAIAARDKATPGPWKAELCVGGSYVIDNTLPENSGKVRRIAEVYGHLSTPSDARLIAAAPEMADWIKRALPWLIEVKNPLLEELATWKVGPRHDRLVQLLAEIDALIAEAEDNHEHP